MDLLRSLGPLVGQEVVDFALWQSNSTQVPNRPTESSFGQNADRVYPQESLDEAVRKALQADARREQQKLFEDKRIAELMQMQYNAEVDICEEMLNADQAMAEALQKEYARQTAREGIDDQESFSQRHPMATSDSRAGSQEGSSQLRPVMDSRGYGQSHWPLYQTSFGGPSTSNIPGPDHKNDLPTTTHTNPLRNLQGQQDAVSMDRNIAEALHQELQKTLLLEEKYDETAARGLQREFKLSDSLISHLEEANEAVARNLEEGDIQEIARKERTNEIVAHALQDNFRLEAARQSMCVVCLSEPVTSGFLHGNR